MERTTIMKEQTIELPLEPGSRVVLYESVDMDEEGGYIADVLYEGHVEQYVPETGLLKLSDGIGRIEFLELVEEADGYEVIQRG